MPEPNRSPWRVAPDLTGFPVRDSITASLSVRLVCEGCRHEARWSPEDLGRRFAKTPDTTFNRIGSRLRCSRCRSDWVMISRA